MPSTADRDVAKELSAIKAVADALTPLPDDSRRHVIAYVAELLGFAGTPVAAEGQLSPPPVETPVAPSTPITDPTPGAISDVRSLKEQKLPRSANEMVALVAYYVSELAPADERRTTITSADVEKYFKQAQFRLPSRVTQALPDAARAGYLDVVERGQYRLNPVGYNLVAHGLPAATGEKVARASRARRPAKKVANKSAARSAAKIAAPKHAKRTVAKKRG